MMNPDQICEKYSNNGVKITIKELEDDTILIESDSQGLRFLSELLASQIESLDTGFQISPFGAGKAMFTKDSNKGIYINRSPESSTVGKQRVPADNKG